VSHLKAELTEDETKTLRKLHDSLMHRAAERANKDDRYFKGDYDGDTLEVVMAADNHDLPLMRAYDRFSSRHAMKHIEGALRALRSIESETDTFIELEDALIIQRSVIRSAYAAHKLAQEQAADGMVRHVVMHVDVDEVTQYVYTNPQNLSLVLAAINEGHSRAQDVIHMVERMSEVEPALVDGVL
jgi:hypothetical protein